jgi:protein tyrosine/serine phosphatase
VETNKMRYFNIPVNSSSPRPEQADEFLRITRDKTNHPMLVTCATANRVGAFMMILRVLEQGWSLEEAGDEAAKIGLRGDELKKFARDYIAQQKTKRGRG